MNREEREQIQPLALSDIVIEAQRKGETLGYRDDELIIIDDLRDIPDFTGYKISFNIVLVCVRGKLQLEVTGEQVSVSDGQIIVCRSHTVLSNYMVSPSVECKLLCVSDHLLRTILASQMQLWNKMLYHHRFIIINAEAESLAIYQHLSYQWIRDDSPFKREILISMLRAALLELCDQMMHGESEKESGIVSHGSSRMEMLFHQFLEHLASRHMKKLSVADYANEMCITPKYLSTICRTVSDKSPMTWISEYVMEDITYYLRQTDLTAKEISDELGFPNASYFGKYVRERLGMSPNEYRKKLRSVAR